MAVATKEFAGRYIRLTDESGDNAALSVSTPTDVPLRLLYVAAKYSGSPTQAGVTTELDSGAGAAWDTELNAGSANAQDTVYTPDGEIVAADGDAIKVTAPAGGAGITSAITIVAERL